MLWHFYIFQSDTTDSTVHACSLRVSLLLHHHHGSTVCWWSRTSVQGSLLYWNEIYSDVQRHSMTQYWQHSCFRQLYKTNYLIEWLAISHGCLWRMYQLRKKKILPIVLPSMFEADNFSDHPRISYLTKWLRKYLCLGKLRTKIFIKFHNVSNLYSFRNM